MSNLMLAARFDLWVNTNIQNFGVEINTFIQQGHIIKLIKMDSTDSL